MPLYDPPKAFISRLRAYDPLLRVRWSDREMRWRIERRITRARWVDPKTYSDKHAEDYFAAREGYCPVLFAEKNQLDDRIFLSLWHMDVWRRGGANRVADEMESAEAMKKAAGRAKYLDEAWVAAREYQRFMNTVSVVPERMRHTSPPGGKSIVAGNEL